MVMSDPLPVSPTTDQAELGTLTFSTEPEPSRTLRTRVVKQVVTTLGIAEITLLDVPLDPRAWNRDEERQFESLERMVAS